MYRLLLVSILILLSNTTFAQADSIYYKYGKMEEKIANLEKNFDKHCIDLKERLEVKKENMEFHMNIITWSIAAFGVLIALIGFFVGRKLFKDVEEKKKEAERIQERTEKILDKVEDKKDLFDKKVETAIERIEEEAKKKLAQIDSYASKAKEAARSLETLAEIAKQIPSDENREENLEKIKYVQESKDTSPFEKDWANALRLYYDDNFDEAIIHFKQILATTYEKDLTKSQLTSLFINMAYSYNEIENTQDALHCYEIVLTINPSNATAWYNKGCIFNTMGKDYYPKAIEAYDKAIEINPKLAQAWSNRGHTLEEMGEEYYQEALRSYNKALEVNPKKTNTWYQKGILHLKMKNDKMAMESLKHALNYKDAKRKIKEIEDRMNTKEG